MLACGMTASAQIYKIHDFQVGISAKGRYVTPIANENSVTPRPTEGVGGLLNIREAPKPWLGLELNYGWDKYSERFTTGAGPTLTTTPVTLTQHELTVGYVAHVKTLWGVQPFVVVGGGATAFLPRTAPNQWRGAGMYEVGFDIVPKSTPHVAFRFQQHGLIYKAPDFYVNAYRSNTWVHQSSPSAGVVLRF